MKYCDLPSSPSGVPSHLSPVPADSRKPIKVLGLFDGIATGQSGGGWCLFDGIATGQSGGGGGGCLFDGIATGQSGGGWCVFLYVCFEGEGYPLDPSSKCV